MELGKKTGGEVRFRYILDYKRGTGVDGFAVHKVSLPLLHTMKPFPVGIEAMDRILQD